MEAIIVAVISFVGVGVSAMVSWGVAHYSIKAEIKKLNMTWSREDIVSSEEEFSKMAEAVGRYAADYSNDELQAEAAGKVAAIRAKEIGTLGETLDSLYADVISPPSHSKLCKGLTLVIDAKRAIKTRLKSDKR